MADNIPASYHWRDALDTAIARNRRDAHGRYLQLATIDEGYPATRNVVFRGFLEDGSLTLVTDARSGKVSQVARHPGVEACWYFTRSREQFRIRGQLRLADGRGPDAEARKRAWSRLSDAARAQFFWRTPGAALAQGCEPELDEAGIPDVFLLGILTPERIDHLQLAPSPQQRVISMREGGEWHAVPVNP